MFGGQGSEVLGGSGGTIHLPNGGTARSKVSEHLWGTTTDIYARDAIDMQKIEQMATKFFTDAIEEAVSASEEQISNAVASYVNEKLCTGGG